MSSYLQVSDVDTMLIPCRNRSLDFCHCAPLLHANDKDLKSSFLCDKTLMSFEASHAKRSLEALVVNIPKEG